MRWSKQFRPGAWTLAAFSLLGVAACVRPTAPTGAQAPPARAEAAAVTAEATAAARQRVLSIDSTASLLTIAVRRSGPLARLGHNHVIAMRDIEGEVRCGADLQSASFEWTQPVDRMTVDEAALRANAGPDFSAPVPEEARVGTRANMLGAALLQAAEHPRIRVVGRVSRLLSTDRAELTVDVQVRGQATQLLLPVRYAWRDADTLEVEGEFELQQTQLGLVPFSVMMGALQVDDRMQLGFRVVARVAPEKPR